MLHYAVKAGNKWAIYFLHGFYTKRVDTADNSWHNYMLTLDAEGYSVYDNAPNKVFKDWLNSPKPVKTLIDGCGFSTATANQTFSSHEVP